MKSMNKIDLIKECKEKGIEFEYDEEAVVAVYKLAKDCAKKISVSREKYDDFIQDSVMHFFTYVIYKYDPSKNISISTYAYTAFSNLNMLQERKKSVKFHRAIISLDDVVRVSNGEDEVTLGDAIKDCNLTPLEKIEQDELNAFLEEKLEEDQTLYKFYVEGKGQYEIAEEMGVSQAQVSRRIKSKLKKIRHEGEKQGLVKNKGRK